MTDVNSFPFLQIGEQTLSLGNALRYLQLSGKLVPLVQEIVGLHVVLGEIQTQNEALDIDLPTLEQNIINFRMQQQLTDQERFQEWLNAQGIDYASFQQRVLIGLKIEKFKDQLAESRIENLFEQQNVNLEQVDMSCIVTTEQAPADQLHEQILNGVTSFEEMAVKLATSTQPGLGFTRSINQRRQLPASIQQAIATAGVGQMVGPIEAGGRYFLCRIETITPATLDGQIERELREFIFNQWLAGQLNELPVKLVTES